LIVFTCPAFRVVGEGTRVKVRAFLGELVMVLGDLDEDVTAEGDFDFPPKNALNARLGLRMVPVLSGLFSGSGAALACSAFRAGLFTFVGELNELIPLALLFRPLIPLIALEPVPLIVLTSCILLGLIPPLDEDERGLMLMGDGTPVALRRVDRTPVGVGSLLKVVLTADVGVVRRVDVEEAEAGFKFELSFASVGVGRAVRDNGGRGRGFKVGGEAIDEGIVFPRFRVDPVFAVGVVLTADPRVPPLFLASGFSSLFTTTIHFFSFSLVAVELPASFNTLGGSNGTGGTSSSFPLLVALPLLSLLRLLGVGSILGIFGIGGGWFCSLSGGGCDIRWLAIVGVVVRDEEVLALVVEEVDALALCPVVIVLFGRCLELTGGGLSVTVKEDSAASIDAGIV